MFNRKRIFMGKKAGEKVLSIWWFFVLFVVAWGIIAGVMMFASAEVDIKEVEAGVLADKVAGCIVEQGYLRSDFANQGSSFDIFKECGINENIIRNSQNYYLEISAYDAASCSESECTKRVEKLDFSAGMRTFLEDCKIKENAIEAKALPRCSGKIIFAINKHNKAIPEKIVLKILAGSNQKGRSGL